MANQQDKSPEDQHGSTRIVAGQPAKPTRPVGLKIGIAAAVLALIGGGAAVASAVNSGTPAASQEAAPSGNPAAELKLGYHGLTAVFTYLTVVYAWAAVAPPGLTGGVR